MSLTNKLLSGIEINQNIADTAAITSLFALYQEFYLPTNIERGTDASEVHIPELTGFQILLNVTSLDQVVTWAVERQRFGLGWTPVVNGVTTGAQAINSKVWFDIYFDELITVDPTALSDKFRLKIGPDGATVWYGVAPGYIAGYWSDTTELPNSSTLAFRLLTASGDSGIDFLGNQYRHAVYQRGIDNVSTDGEESRYWFSKPNPSKFAIENLYFDLSVNSIASVVDSILIDPVTPDVYFSVYYTSEGVPGTNADEWNDKLWTRVPSTFQAKRRETHIMPTPFLARYVKIEFSHLQAKSYSPGLFQQPVRYQKHPKWVLDYFLARIAEQDSISEKFVSQRTEIRYDALDLAYNYYLDDLKQDPDGPVKLDTGQLNDLQSFLQNRTDLSDQIDNTTALKINTVMQPYQRGFLGFIAGDHTSQALELTTPREVGTIVSTIHRDAVVFEQSFPVMFFYLPARHRYREVEATFAHDRAYFVGIRQVAFLREQYTKATDTNIYIEIGGDTVNVANNDFVHNGSSLVIADG